MPKPEKKLRPHLYPVPAGFTATAKQWTPSIHSHSVCTQAQHLGRERDWCAHASATPSVCPKVESKPHLPHGLPQGLHGRNGHREPWGLWFPGALSGCSKANTIKALNSRAQSNLSDSLVLQPLALGCPRAMQRWTKTQISGSRFLIYKPNKLNGSQEGLEAEADPQTQSLGAGIGGFPGPLQALVNLLYTNLPSG